MTPLCPTMSGLAKFTTAKLVAVADLGAELRRRPRPPTSPASGRSSRTSRGLGTRIRVSPGRSASTPPLKKYVTWAYFSVSATCSCRRPCSASTSASVSATVCSAKTTGAVELVAVARHRRQVDAGVDQQPRELPAAVRAEVEEDRGVARLDPRRALDHDRLDELVGHAGVVARLHGFQAQFGACAPGARRSARRRRAASDPSAGRDPSRSSGRRRWRSDPAGSSARSCERRMRRDVAAVGEGVDPGLLGRELEQRAEVVDVRVDAAAARRARAGERACRARTQPRSTSFSKSEPSAIASFTRIRSW